jgi:hypothetical protein
LDGKALIEHETLSKILKILGLESEELKSKFSKPLRVQDAVEEFKTLVITRGIVDKFSSKPRHKLKTDNKAKETEVLQQRLETESFSDFSSESQELEKTLSGNQFLMALHKQCKKEVIFLNIPESIVLFTSAEPVKLWSSAGQVYSKTFSLKDLKQELCLFKKNVHQDYSSFVLRLEYHSSKSILYESLFFEFEQFEELVRKIEEISYFKTPVLISSFVKFKGILPSKTRAVFSAGIPKIYFISAKEKAKHKDKRHSCWVTRIVPSKLLESLQFSTQELELFEWGFKCKVVFPINSKSIYFEKELFQLEFLKFTSKLLKLLKSILKTCLKLSIFIKHKQKLFLFKSYLCKKLDKIEKFISKALTSLQNPQPSKKKWLKSQFIKLSNKCCKIYQITNQKKQEWYQPQYKEICKVLKGQLRSNLTISGCVADFIESSEGLYLIKLLKVSLEIKKHSKLPVISSTKHISLFSATEGSG